MLVMGGRAAGVTLMIIPGKIKIVRDLNKLGCSRYMSTIIWTSYQLRRFDSKERHWVGNSRAQQPQLSHERERCMTQRADMAEPRTRLNSPLWDRTHAVTPTITPMHP